MFIQRANHRPAPYERPASPAHKIPSTTQSPRNVTISPTGKYRPWAKTVVEAPQANEPEDVLRALAALVRRGEEIRAAQNHVPPPEVDPRVLEAQAAERELAEAVERAQAAKQKLAALKKRKRRKPKGGAE